MSFMESNGHGQSAEKTKCWSFVWTMEEEEVVVVVVEDWISRPKQCENQRHCKYEVHRGRGNCQSETRACQCRLDVVMLRLLPTPLVDSGETAREMGGRNLAEAWGKRKSNPL